MLQGSYGIRSERVLVKQLPYNLLFRGFVGISFDDPTWHQRKFTKNRERLLNEQVMARFLDKLMGAPKVKPLLSDERFSVDGTLHAWASNASLERIEGKDDPPPRHRVLARGLGRKSPESGGRKGISAASNSATRPIAPARMPTRWCAGNPRPI